MTKENLVTTEHPSLTEILDLSKITLVREAFCRPVSTYKMMMMIKKGYDPKAFQFVSLHLQSDGAYSILDGQHRIAMLQKLGITRLPANVFMDLTYEERAELTDKLNFTNRQTATNKFQYRYHYREPRAVGIVKIVREFGLDLEGIEGNYRGRGSVGVLSCVSALDEAYADLGAEGFRHVLDVMYQVWSTDRQAWVTDIVLGFRQFWARYHDKLDKQRLIEKLRRVSVDELYQIAGTVGARSENKSSRLGKAVVQIYNHRLHPGKRLGPWQDYTGTKIYQGERTDWGTNSTMRRKIYQEEKKAREARENLPEGSAPQPDDLTWLY